MKKIMFFALATVGLFASCSSDDALTSDAQKAAQELDGREAIRIGLGNVSTIETKGTGTVGGVKAVGSTVDHNWAGQEVKLFMFKYAMNGATKGKLTFDLAMNDLKTPKIPLFNGDSLTATGYAGETAGNLGASDPTPLATDFTAASPVDGVIRYYPQETKQAYEFFGYRVDDAWCKIVNEPKKDGAIVTGYEEGTDEKLKVSFTINGTQDVLLAKAAPVKVDGSAVTDAEELNNSFSAWASRHNISPKLNFKHMLSRLTFAVKAGNAQTATNVKIGKIEVLSQDSITMTIADIANTEINDSRLEWGPIVYEDGYETRADRDDHIIKGAKWFELMDRTGADKDPLTELAPNHATDLNTRKSIITTDFTSLGEAIMVKPGESTYKVRVWIYEDLDMGTDGTINQYSPIEGTITIAGTGGAQRSTSYKVQITVFGHEKIDIFTSLEPWSEVTEPIDVNDQDKWNL